MPDAVEVKFSPPDLIRRMADVNGRKLSSVMMTAMRRTLYSMASAVPPYPSRGPTSYKRTGTLGRSLVVGGFQNVSERRQDGPTQFEARLGTRVEYAQYVIGENQAWMHKGIWWTVKDWAKRVQQSAQSGEIRVIFERAAQELADYLGGKG